MKIATLLASLVVLAFLSGCATRQVVWSKPGITPAQGEKDLQECADRANMIYPAPTNQLNPHSPSDGTLDTGFILDQQVLKDNFSKCMGSKGYKYAGTQPVAAGR